MGDTMKPETKQRIAQIRRGEVPEGYQKTRDGIFPADWHIQKINRWIALAERPITLENDKKYRLVTVRRGFGGIDLRGESLGKDILVKNYFRVFHRDFLISKRQIAHGACGIVTKFLDGAVVSNEYNVFVPKPGTDIEMFNLMMQLPHYTRLFYLMSDGVHIEKLLFKTQDWMKRQLAMPPIAEQKKIAAILTTQDKVIELKEKGLAEKQRQKKYLMQQLLTGRKRLPGFNKTWNTVELGEIFDYIQPTKYLVKTTDYDNAYKTPVLTAGKTFILGYTSETKDVYTNVPVVIFDDFTTATQYVDFPFKVKSSALKILAVKDGFNIFFAYEAMQLIRFAVGGHERHWISQYSCLTIDVPEIGEQSAIAQVLSTADREISLLRQDIEQEKQKKKALMQLLLTGIVRVCP